jgi:hypothetical protein
MLSNGYGKIDMSALERQAHWQNVYQTKGERDVSWFQKARLSLLISFGRPAWALMHQSLI